MNDPAAWTIHIDGAARGNPGPASFAYVIARDGGRVIEDKGFLGSATNNFAEYTALVRALERAAELGAERLVILSDSELLVKQMNGLYKVKNEGLRELYEEAMDLCRRFQRVSIRHVPREANRHADRLCNEALDGAGKPATAPPRKKKAPAASSPRLDNVRDEALACLRAAAGAWTRGEGNALSPEDVWDQLWSILEEHGLLARAGGRRGEAT
jgi:ribonuclease HI